MNKLLDSDSNSITEFVSEMLKHPDAVKVRNRLLDGSYHVQSIGNSVDVVDITCVMSEVGKTKLDDAYNQDSPVTIEWYGEYYTGPLEAEPLYEYFMKGFVDRRLYSVSFSFVVSSEGSL